MPATPRDPGHAVLPVYAERVLRMRVTRRWWLQAACATADVQVRSNPERLAGLCRRCLVRKSCLATALLVDPDGIWAATDRPQRVHARAEMTDGEPPGRVFGQLLTTSVAGTDEGGE